MTDLEKAFTRALRNLGSDESRRAYRGDWQRWSDWCDRESIDLLAARPGDVEDHLAALRQEGCKRATLGRALAAIRSIYSYLVRDELCAVNPAREVKAPRFDSRPKVPWLTEEGIKQLFASIPEPDSWKGRRSRVCLSLLFGLGWRRAEVARLRIEDFKEGQSGRTVTGLVKGGKEITVGVPPWVWSEIEAWLPSLGGEGEPVPAEGPLLPQKFGQPTSISGDIVYQIVKEAALAAGVTINPHGLRRTNITLAGERGVSAKMRQLAVGHSSVTTTERYDMARDAAKNAPGQIFEDLVKS
jgi:integrase/recombinase XerD